MPRQQICSNSRSIRKDANKMADSASKQASSAPITKNPIEREISCQQLDDISTPKRN